MSQPPQLTLSFLNEHIAALKAYTHRADIILDSIRSHQFLKQIRKERLLLETYHKQLQEEAKQHNEAARELSFKFFELHKMMMEHLMIIQEHLENSDEYQKLIKEHEQDLVEKRERTNEEKNQTLETLIELKERHPCHNQLPLLRKDYNELVTNVKSL